MLTISFLHPPSQIQNDSQPKVDGDIDDIVISGYRRSLSDWLVICGKSHAQYLSLRERGYSCKTSLLHGLRYSRSTSFYTRDLTTSHKPLIKTRLNNYAMRHNRITAWLYKYHKSLTISQCSLLATYSLTYVYEAYRQEKAWKPDKLVLWPWTEVLPLTLEEEGIWKTIHSSPIFLYTEEGIYPSQKLIAWYARELKKHAFLLVWADKFRTYPCSLNDVVDKVKLAAHCGVPPKSLYRSFSEKRLDITGKKTLKELILLAERADKYLTTKRLYRQAGTIGYKGKRKEKKSW